MVGSGPSSDDVSPIRVFPVSGAERPPCGGETRVVAAGSCIAASLLPIPGLAAIYHLQTSRLDDEVVAVTPGRGWSAAGARASGVTPYPGNRQVFWEHDGAADVVWR